MMAHTIYGRFSWAQGTWLVARAILGLALLTAETPVTAASPPPNIVLFVVDDLGWADAAAWGSRYHRTPRIDDFTRQGVRFTAAYAASPVCSPTRASLLTGRNPARLHLTDWLPGPRQDKSRALWPPDTEPRLPLSAPTLAERLRAAGYRTAHIGKWHLGGAGAGPTTRGFESNVGGDHHGTPPGYFSPYGAPADPLPGLPPGPDGEYLTDRLTAEAVRFISDAGDQPFFLHLAHYAVHVPMQAKPGRVAANRARPRPATGQRNPVYAAMLDSVDESLGRVLDALGDAGIARRTIVVFTSDNGGLVTEEGPDTPATSNLPLRAGKGFLYEGGIRVPLVIAGPGVERAAGAIEATPVISDDLSPTLLALAGLPPDPAADGISLVPLLRDGRTLPPRNLYWHYPHYSVQGGRPGGAVRAGNYKLIEPYESGDLELYDLAADPGENRNLAGELPDRAADLQRQLAAWRRAVGAQEMTAAKPWWKFW